MATRSIVNVLGCGLALLLLSSCSSVPQQINISAKPIERPQLILPDVDKLELRPVEWVIITPQTSKAEFDRLRKLKKPLAFFAMDEKGYAALGLNFSDIRALVQQQQTIIDAYKKYYTESTKSFDDAEQSIKETNEKADFAAGIRKQNSNVLDKLNPFK